MRIIAVDDETIALQGLISAIKEAAPHADIKGFRYADEAIEYVKSNSCDIAFLDIEMIDMNGIELAERLKQYNPELNIIFATGFSTYMKSAFDLHASGYINKPISVDSIKKELNNLRRPVASLKKIRVQAFGNFQVFVQDAPIKFKYQRTKELLAYLVDRRGALCSKGELMAVLFSDDTHQKYYHQLRLDLINTLESYGCDTVVVQERGALGIATDKVICDYYDYLNGKEELSRLYHGEYMAQYSFAEITNAELSLKLNKH